MRGIIIRGWRRDDGGGCGVDDDPVAAATSLSSHDAGEIDVICVPVIYSKLTF